MMLIKNAFRYLGVLLCVPHIASTNMHALKPESLMNINGSVCCISTVRCTLNLEGY